MNKKSKKQKEIDEICAKREIAEWEERLKNAQLRLKKCCMECYDILCLDELESELKTASMSKNLSIPSDSSEVILQRYKHERNIFLYNLYKLANRHFIDEEVCIACARWLKKYEMNHYNFPNLIKLIAYECGTNKENTLNYLEKLTQHNFIGRYSILDKQCNLHSM